MAQLDARTDDFIRLLLDVSGRARPSDLHGVAESEGASLLQAYAAAHPERSLAFADGVLAASAAPAPAAVVEPPAPVAAGPAYSEPVAPAPAAAPADEAWAASVAESPAQVPAHEAWAEQPPAAPEPLTPLQHLPDYDQPAPIEQQPVGAPDPYAAPAPFGAPDPYAAAAQAAPDPYAAPATYGAAEPAAAPYAIPAPVPTPSEHPFGIPAPGADAGAYRAAEEPFAPQPAAPQPFEPGPAEYAVPAQAAAVPSPAETVPYASTGGYGDIAGPIPAADDWQGSAEPVESEYPAPAYADEPALAWYWWAAPILFGVIGGVIAWVVLRPSRPRGARTMLIAGAVVTAIHVIVGILATMFMFGAAMTAMSVGALTVPLGIPTA